jgi:ribosome maturation factor RimP
MATDSAVRELVADVVAAAGARVYDVELAGGVLRVSVQRDGGIDLDGLADLNRAISRVLDEADPIPGSYVLEVSSPGLERRLRSREHWEGAIGERVKVKRTREAAPTDRRVEGIVGSVNADTVTLHLDDGTEVSLRLEQIESARTTFEWGPAPKPGGGRGGRERTST